MNPLGRGRYEGKPKQNGISSKVTPIRLFAIAVKRRSTSDYRRRCDFLAGVSNECKLTIPVVSITVILGTSVDFI